MTLFVGQADNPNRQRASQVAGSAAAIIGAVSFVAWWTSLPLLSRWGPGLATVKPTTALCLIALGLALMHPAKNSRVAFPVGLTVVTIAMLDLLDRFGIDSGINRLNRVLVPEAAVPGSETLFHTINGVPVALTLTGTSLALSCFEKRRFVAAALGCLVGVTQIYGLLAYLSGIHTFYGSIATPRPPTDAGLLCVAIAIVLRMGMTPELRRPRPLWHLLVLLGCAILAPLLLYGLYTGLRITNAQLDQVRNELMSMAYTLSADIDREISGEIKRLQAFAASPSLRRGDFAEFQRQAEASLALPEGSNIVLIDRNMRRLVDTWAPFGASTPKPIAQKSIEKALATGKPQVTGLLIGRMSQEFPFDVIVPVEIDGENRYALVGSPERRNFVDLLAARGLPPGWQAAVSDAAHRIIAGSGQEDAFMGQELPRTQWHPSGPGGISECVDSQGWPSLEAHTWSELTGWQTAVWAPTTRLEAPVRALWWTIGLTALTTFALAVVMASWLGRLIARSVGFAVRAASVLGEGGVLSLNGTPVAEINTLMAELRRAAARRQAAEQDLHASKDQLQVSKDQLQVSKDQLQVSKDRLQLAFDATQLGWWQYDTLRGIISGDARFKEIFDVTTDEISIEDLIKRVHPDDRERFRANREAALDPTKPEAYLHDQCRVPRRDGTVCWVEAYGLAYFEGAGSERRVVSFGGTVRDITGHKEREEKEHLLMREINHRAKNMLSVVDSIAHQTATRSPEDFVQRFSERVQALSANQDLLVRNEWQGVDVEDLVGAQLAHFANLIGSRIVLQGPKLRLNPASAQALGLALHELATNAGKYGALSTDKGRIDIRWGRDGDSLNMSWIERDGPPVTMPGRGGFGTTVMKAMAERSLYGTVQLDYAQSGLIWRLTCPLTRVLEPRGGADSQVSTLPLETSNQHKRPASNA